VYKGCFEIHVFEFEDHFFMMSTPMVYPEPSVKELVCQDWPNAFDVHRLKKDIDAGHEAFKDCTLFFRGVVDGEKPYYEVNFIHQWCLVAVSDYGHVEIQGPKREELMAACHTLNPLLAKYITDPVVPLELYKAVKTAIKEARANGTYIAMEDMDDSKTE